MPGFKEWLAQEAQIEGSVAKRRQLVEEWTDSVADLYAQVVAWLAEDDSENVLTIQTGKVQKAEEGLGAYEVSTMRISLSARFVDLVPLARNVVGAIGNRGDLGFRAEGRVDMTNGAEKYMFYRIVVGSDRKWVIVDDENYSVKELSKGTFEIALQDLLS